MAKSNLLDTKTITFSELVGNGKSFVVPQFQRDYSWAEEQWEDLWLDLERLRQNSSERHYMGSLVVEQESDQRFLVIDGQQRIATLSILALAVIEQLRILVERGIDSEGNAERAQSLRNTFIGQKDPVSLLHVSKLELNQTDNGFYQDNLVNLRVPTAPRSMPTSNRQLWECFRWFWKQISGDEALANDGKALASLLSDVAGRKLLFIQITVDDEMNAYTVFETLNARGMELSATDLLKNYLFSRLKSKPDLQALERRWRKLIETVRQERFPEFLRYHLLCTHRQVRQQRLFQLLRDEVKQQGEVFALVDALEKRAEIYSALLDPDHEYWVAMPDAKLYIRELRLFGVRQFAPLVFAAFEKFDQAYLTRVLKLISNLTFRYNTISGQNTNHLEGAYHEAASGILQGRIKTPAEVFRALDSIYVPDDKFKQDFSVAVKNTAGKSSKLVKYILCRLESDARNSPVDFEVEPASIEHILPENPSSDWETGGFPAENWDKYTLRLGNLALLEKTLNREAGNGGYAAKLSLYEKSQYATTKDIAIRYPEEWTIAHLEARQARMAERAVHIWRSDFA